MSITRLVAIAAFTLLAAATAQAQILVGPGANTKANEEPFPLRGQVSVSQSVGSGTFASVWNPTTSTSLSLAPWWRVTPTFVLALNQSYEFEWTPSNTTTQRNQVEMTDLALRAIYLGFRWPELGMSTIVSGSYDIPLSVTSRQIGSLGSVGASGRVNWIPKGTGLFVFGGLSLSANPIVASFGQRVGSQEGKAFEDRTLGTINPATCVVRNPRELDNFACLDGRLPSVFSARINGGVSWTPPILDNSLFIGVSGGYAQGYSAYVPSNEGTNNLGYDNADLQSVHAADGIVPRQLTTGNVSVSWMPANFYFLTVGASSSQPLLDARGNLMRFPFWDFVSPYNNFSSLYVDATFMF